MLSLLLGACGGGGGNGAPGAEGAPGPAGASGPAGPTGGIGEQGNLLKRVITDKAVNAEPNTGYFATNDDAEVVVTLPTEAQPGDVVRVEGIGRGGWKIAQNEKQTVKLDLLGQNWTTQVTDVKRRWQAVATSSDGSKVVGGVFDGSLHTSTDGGWSWTPRDFGTTVPWSSFAYSGDGTKLGGCGSWRPDLDLDR